MVVVAFSMSMITIVVAICEYEFDYYLIKYFYAILFLPYIEWQQILNTCHLLTNIKQLYNSLNSIKYVHNSNTRNKIIRCDCTTPWFSRRYP